MKVNSLNFLIIIIIIYFNTCFESNEDITMYFFNKIKIGRKSKEIYLIVNSLTSKTSLFTNTNRDYYEEIKSGRKDDKLVDSIEISGKKVDDFTFNLKKDDTDLNDLTVQGELGLGINKYNSSDLIDALYKNEIISSKVLELELNEKDDLININLEPNVKKFKYCDLSLKKNFDKKDFYFESWICDLNHILMGSTREEIVWDKAYEVKGEVVFDTRSKYIYIPKEFMKYISDIWEINNNKCKLVRDLQSDEKYFVCTRDMTPSIYSMKSIYFIIGGYAYRLKAEDLFENDGKNLISLIRFINDEKNLWILGTPFFRKYNYLLDYDNLKFGINGEDIKDFNEQYEQWTVEVKEEEAKILNAPSGEKVIGIIGGIVGICIILYVWCYFYRFSRRDKPKYDFGPSVKNNHNELY